LRSKIISLLPSNVECYAEVFAGAAWVLFGKPRHPVEVINDANGDLVNLYRVLKWRPSELLEEVQKCLYSREVFNELKNDRPPQHDELRRAVWFYCLIQMAFGAELSNIQSARFGYWNRSRGDLFLYKSERQFFPAAERLKGVFVEKLDFADLIRRYDQPRTLFYCDPPYLDTCSYAESFGYADHERLALTLKSIQGRFLLTINDHPEIKNLYSGFDMIEAKEARAKARAQEGRQGAPILIIANYDLPNSARVIGSTPQQVGLFSNLIQ
jgi:DNA adenine methylase